MKDVILLVMVFMLDMVFEWSLWWNDRVPIKAYERRIFLQVPDLEDTW